MTHSEFLASLTSDEMVRLTKRRDGPALWRAMWHFGLLGLGALWIGLGWPLWWLVLPIHGIGLMFLFTLEHECTHKTPFATEAIGEGLGRVCGFVLLIPFAWFRAFHFAHHRHTHIPGKDPELDGGLAHMESWPAFVWHVSGLPLWWSLLKTLSQSAAGYADHAYIPQRARGRIIREARWHSALYALAVLSLLWSPLLFWIWVLPALLGQPFLRLYLMAEHGRCAFVSNMFDNTRTTYTNRLVRALAWNMPYHTEHHVLPNAPFHALPALHARMSDHLQHTSAGYGAFTRETLRDLPSRH